MRDFRLQNMVDPDAEDQVIWQGELTKQKWMLFFTKILKDIENDKGIRIHINFSITDNKVMSPDKIREIEAAMREFGMDRKIKFVFKQYYPNFIISLWNGELFIDL